MRNWKYSLTLLLVIALAPILKAESIDRGSKSRTVEEVFDVGSQPELIIVNKYGDLNVETWDRDQIKINVTIKVDGSNKDKVEEYLEGIEIDFDKRGDQVSAVTEFPEVKTSWWSGSWWGGSSNINFEIDYEVWAPPSVKTQLETKYGNMYVADIDGRAKLINKYGDISCGNIGGDVEISLGYGNASIGDCGDTRVVLKYGSIRAGHIGTLNIESKYSKVYVKSCEAVLSNSKYDQYDIGKASSIRNEGKYDAFEVQELGDLDIDTKYTNVDIHSLSKGASFDLKYGVIKIHSIDSDAMIVLDADRADFYINTGSTAAEIDFDGEHTDIDLSSVFRIESEDIDDEDHELRAIKGSAPHSVIRAVMEWGKLRID